MTPSRTELSYVHRGGTQPLIHNTIDRFFRGVVGLFPNNDAVVSVEQRLRLTYRAFDEAVERVARGLMALEVKPGDTVGIWSTDHAEWVVLQMATARIGAVLVNINPAYRKHELAYALERVGLQTLVLIPSFKSSDYAGMMRELCPELEEQQGALELSRFPRLKHVILYEPGRPERTDRPAPGFTVWPELLAAGELVSAPQVRERERSLDPDDPINIQFTSGTTGFPKPVVLTHHNILNNAYSLGDMIRLTQRDRLCVPVPFYHCFGMVVSNLLCLTRGATIVIPAAHFDSGAVLRAIEEEGCTALHGVPTMFVAELERDDFRQYDLTSLRTGIMAGAPCPPELMHRVIDEMGMREIHIGYGMTEASPVTHITRLSDSFERRVETVGTNLPHQECKIVDPATGDIVPIGEAGEICFRGYNVMREYLDDEESTREAIDDNGWLHSGDLGVLDRDGYLKITGRLKEMIIRGGENIYPAEIEAFYFEHPKIAEVAVFGIPDERMGEEVGAWIRLHRGVEATPDELRDYARGRIAHFKIPRHVWVVDEFPMTVTGKIQKFRIREIVSEWLAEARPAGAPA